MKKTPEEVIKEVRAFCVEKESECRAIEIGPNSTWKRESYARRRACYGRVIKKIDELTKS